MIGIVTISFNQGAFLEESLVSVAENRKDVDVCYVVVDAASSDRSGQILDRHRDDIDVLIQEPDQGPADGLNKGFAYCDKCDLLGYINADDRLRPGALKWVKAFFDKHPHVDVLLGAIAMIDEKGHVSRRARVSDRFDAGRYAIGACNAFQQGTFFRKSIFDKTQGFNIQNRTCWDGELVVDFALSGAVFQVTSKILGDFRLYATSITGSNRLANAYRRDRARIAAKVEASGIPLPAPSARRVERWLYRINPLRQVRYLMAR